MSNPSVQHRRAAGQHRLAAEAHDLAAQLFDRDDTDRAKSAAADAKYHAKAAIAALEPDTESAS